MKLRVLVASVLFALVMRVLVVSLVGMPSRHPGSSPGEDCDKISVGMTLDESLEAIGRNKGIISQRLKRNEAGFLRENGACFLKLDDNLRVVSKSVDLHSWSD